MLIQVDGTCLLKISEQPHCATLLTMVCLQLVPSRQAFFEKFGTPGEALMDDLKRFVDAFAPILLQIHEFLVAHNLNFPTRV